MRHPVDMTKFAKSMTKNLNISYGFNDPTIWVSTGNYILNYLISGKFDRGIPLGKVTMMAGESGSGKSFIVSGTIVRNAQEMGIIPVLFDTENALDEEWLRRLGVNTDPEKLLRFQVSMINDVAKIMSEFMKMYKSEYMDLPKEERPKYLFVIDSLGMLLTDTDVDQFEKGDMKGDLGRKPKQLNALVKNLVNQIAEFDIGVVATNHTYASQDMFDPDDKISGGCLVKGTQVFTNNGLKEIQDINEDDLVLSHDNEYHRVLKTWFYKKSTIKLTLDDGNIFECSPEHKFLIEDNDEYHWKEAKDLNENDEIVSFEEEEINMKLKKKNNNGLF